MEFCKKIVIYQVWKYFKGINFCKSSHFVIKSGEDMKGLKFKLQGHTLNSKKQTNNDDISNCKKVLT